MSQDRVSGIVQSNVRGEGESMRDRTRLISELDRLDGRGFSSYRALAGVWSLDDFDLRIDHVQADPFAAPTRVSVVLSAQASGLSDAAYRTSPRRLGVAAHLARSFARAARAIDADRRGSGHSGNIRMMDPGQVVTHQSAVQMDGTGQLEARFTIGLPARGRRIDGRGARELLLRHIPDLVSSTLLTGAHDPAEIERCAATHEDASALRDALGSRDLVAFVANGSVLPRRSGADDRPLDLDSTILFQSPPSLETEFVLPNRGAVRGMGIPSGITVIVGGGFHGKSTLLRALQNGIWDHAPDDGREFAVTRTDAVKVRAEDGRSVAGVDISPFIDDLPGGRATSAFHTQHASGSTSQAAAIIEALEMGSRLLLIDEDTSATNFMSRDRRMQELVPAAGEPITPMVDRIEELRDDLGVSTIVVVGGTGDYLDVADLVLRMDGFRPSDVTRQARDTAALVPTGRTTEVRRPLELGPVRTIDRTSVNPARGRRAVHVKAPDERTLLFGREIIDVQALEQVVGRGQLQAIGLVLASVVRSGPGDRVIDVREAIEEALREGLDSFDDRRTGDLMACRSYEAIAVLNRLRTLRVR